MGLKLSEDGQNWIPIDSESTNILREGVQTSTVESEAPGIVPLVGAGTAGVGIGLTLVAGYFILTTVVPILGVMFVLFFLFWLFLVLIGMSPSESMAYIFDTFG